VTNYQNIFLLKFLTLFNCYVQFLADNLLLIEGCLTIMPLMVEMTNRLHLQHIISK